MIVDNIGGDVFAPCLAALAIGGRFVTIGRMGGVLKGELDLDRRREPAQQITGPLRDKESRLSEVVLGGDRLHRLVRQPLRKRADRRRVAAEQSARKGVDLVKRNAHDGPRRVMGYIASDACRMTAKKGKT